MLRRFLEQLSMRLSGIYLVAKELTLRITFSNRQRYKRCFKIPQPTNDVDLLCRMFQTHLENFKSEHAIIAVSLEAQPAKPAKHQFGLFEATLRNPQQLYETLARLTALFGTDRVGTPFLEETHRPDAFRMEPFAWRQNDEIRMSNDEGKKAGDLDRGLALRRVRPTATASVFTSKHRHLQSEKIRGQILDQRGPYMLSGNWWDEKSWGRAEWDFQLENGELIRAYESEEQLAIDGIYD
jgi:protein ImuB